MGLMQFSVKSKVLGFQDDYNEEMSRNKAMDDINKALGKYKVTKNNNVFFINGDIQIDFETESIAVTGFFKNN